MDTKVIDIAQSVELTVHLYGFRILTQTSDSHSTWLAQGTNQVHLLALEHGKFLEACVFEIWLDLSNEVVPSIDSISIRSLIKIHLSMFVSDE